MMVDSASGVVRPSSHGFGGRLMRLEEISAAIKKYIFNRQMAELEEELTPASRGVLARVIDAFTVALNALGVEADATTLERLGTVVHCTMSDQGRFYHRTEHVFDLITTPLDDPLATLAAMFHDTVRPRVNLRLNSMGKMLRVTN